MTAKRNPRQ